MSQEINQSAEGTAHSEEELVRKHAKKIIEALLFAANTPLSVHKIRDILQNFYPFKSKDVIDLLHGYKQDLVSEERPLQLEEIAGGFMLRTREDYADYVGRLYRDKKAERLSQAAREVLAIVAFKQPITKPQIEAVRGVDSSATVQMLIEKELVEPVGQAEAPGRPMLYAVSSRFLQHFGLKSVEDLAAGEPEPDSETLECN